MSISTQLSLPHQPIKVEMLLLKVRKREEPGEKREKAKTPF
jgi:hypothetical protein